MQTLDADAVEIPAYAAPTQKLAAPAVKKPKPAEVTVQ